jgi:hypothetical protein
MVEATMRAVGLRAMLKELGIVVEGPIQLFSYASAARSFASRRGVGRMRHLEVRHLWLQGEVAGQRVALWRVAGEANPADLLTKYHKIEAVVKHLCSMSLVWISRNPEMITIEGGCKAPGTFQKHQLDTSMSVCACCQCRCQHCCMIADLAQGICLIWKIVQVALHGSGAGRYTNQLYSSPCLAECLAELLVRPCLQR